MVFEPFVPAPAPGAYRLTQEVDVVAEFASAADAARALLAETAGYGATLVAFSGGVDSSVVVAAAVRALGADRAAAVTAVSPALPAAELAAARRLCADLGVVHHLVETRELEVAGYRDNGPQRCFFCKSTLLEAAVDLARQLGFANVATGTNATDVTDRFRPGIAAAARRGALTPLADAGLGKDAVRAVARLWGLPTWDKPAMACLSSRIAYGLQITPGRLARVERAEVLVRAALGAGADRADVRVRDLGEAVRVEVGPRVAADPAAHPALVAAVRAAGFTDGAVTVEVFRSGSMNAAPQPR
ncbi:ATP-dependent sacrificial sulfur transferase LarE [Actinacidiphila epipremni]|uniref:ATP-dependent sacrificial sulfur transferase LarE n=1 Tax=Actinacidiphila epipremni TaxID=2053013 RepID=A0ABX0ZQU8_9ACTN|nr:ATP-dependent sacrificial sulfur transferase LarE [Actinacidiphila epipremni]NJP43943.1 ATP-dependent sacrificial sulfur transferase LarE [Actinacidiphila epipremni]